MLACCQQVAPERLATLNATLRGIRLGDFEYTDAALYLGAAKGNHFDIILRDAQCEHGPEGALKAAEALKASGFINYFGLQRFGSGSVPTHRSVSLCSISIFRCAGQAMSKSFLNEDSTTQLALLCLSVR